MSALRGLVKRNLLIYFKDRGAVFFSLLSVFMIFLLYILFLAKMNIDGVSSMIRMDRKVIAFLVNSWVMGGILVAGSVTITLGVLGNMVEDEARNRMPAFLVSPVSRSMLILGYVLAAFIIGTVVCLLLFAVSQVYIVAEGGSLLPPRQMLQVVGIILASVFSATCFTFLVVSFLRTTGSYSAVSILIGTTIGMIAGIYIPVGVLPEAVQRFMKWLPVFHNAALMRDVYLKEPVSIVFKGAPGKMLSDYLESMGVQITLGGHRVSNPMKLLIVLGSGLICLVLAIVVMNKRKVKRI